MKRASIRRISREVDSNDVQEHGAEPYCAGQAFAFFGLLPLAPNWAPAFELLAVSLSGSSSEAASFSALSFASFRFSFRSLVLAFRFLFASSRYF
jgi:hypothetical protein